MSDMFAPQLDESTDIASKSSLLVFVRFTWEIELFENFFVFFWTPDYFGKRYIRSY